MKKKKYVMVITISGFTSLKKANELLEIIVRGLARIFSIDVGRITGYTNSEDEEFKDV